MGEDKVQALDVAGAKAWVAEVARLKALDAQELEAAWAAYDVSPGDRGLRGLVEHWVAQARRDQAREVEAWEALQAAWLVEHGPDARVQDYIDELCRDAAQRQVTEPSGHQQQPGEGRVGGER